jgi:Flp pilus assembly protein protease CpaA
MGTGAGIALIAIGAILAFAVHATVAGVNLVTVGWILMVCGVIGLVMDLVIFAPRRRAPVEYRRY